VTDRRDDLQRIEDALHAAGDLLRRHAAGDRAYELKDPHQPVTAADREADALLRSMLPRAGEGWLSEESTDDAARLPCRRVWVVDPLDGTREFVARRDDWSVSIGLVEDGEPVAGGIAAPALGIYVVGGLGHGVAVDGAPAPRPPARAGAAELDVVCSRSEWKRGEWQRWAERGFRIRPVGSVAWKLALVAVARADATWTFRGKNEWDVAAGFALVRAAGGDAWVFGEPGRRFNASGTRMRGIAAATGGAAAIVRDLLQGA
jgi:myo-inositol-1(or 4)-monophosphatase